MLWTGRLVRSEAKRQELRLVERYQALGAHFHALRNAIFGDGQFLNIGFPLAISGLL